jgi:hypothetical protein
MVSRCLNPECREELRYLRHGRVVRVVRGNHEQILVEHYWLCGSCFKEYDFRFFGDGQVALARKPQSVPQKAVRALTLVA